MIVQSSLEPIIRFIYIDAEPFLVRFILTFFAYAYLASGLGQIAKLSDSNYTV